MAAPIITPCVASKSRHYFVTSLVRFLTANLYGVMLLEKHIAVGTPLYGASLRQCHWLLQHNLVSRMQQQQ